MIHGQHREKWTAAEWVNANYAEWKIKNSLEKDENSTNASILIFIQIFGDGEMASQMRTAFGNIDMRSE